MSSCMMHVNEISNSCIQSALFVDAILREPGTVKYLPSPSYNFWMASYAYQYSDTGRPFYHYGINPDGKPFFHSFQEFFIKNLL